MRSKALHLIALGMLVGISVTVSMPARGRRSPPIGRARAFDFLGSAHCPSPDACLMPGDTTGLLSWRGREKYYGP